MLESRWDGDCDRCLVRVTVLGVRVVFLVVVVLVTVVVVAMVAGGGVVGVGRGDGELIVVPRENPREGRALDGEPVLVPPQSSGAFVERLNSWEVRMPSPSVATTTGHVLLWNHVLSLAVVEAVEGGDSNLK